MDAFARELLTWHEHHGRKDLPWQQDTTPYRVWVSEIMLQQTQVATVIEYYQRFMQRFPNIEALAGAPLDEVLHHWTGLGYYARGRNLHKAANTIVNEYGGDFPTTQAKLEALPGIGRSTAGAIRAIAMDQHAAILDGNVKRVLTRLHAVEGYPGETKIAKQLWEIAEAHTPKSSTAIYTQAIMDLGAMLCRRRNPRCSECPVQTSCKAHALGTPEAFPTPKPKKDKPVRHARFFVISCADGLTLLERQPLGGLWGGLWSPPQRDADYSSNAMLAELGHVIAETQHVAPAFRHTFTHYHLEVEPVYVTIAHPLSDVRDDDTWQWVNSQRLDARNDPIGLSAVAVKLLASSTDVFALRAP